MRLWNDNYVGELATDATSSRIGEGFQQCQKGSYLGTNRQRGAFGRTDFLRLELVTVLIHSSSQFASLCRTRGLPILSGAVRTSSKAA